MCPDYLDIDICEEFPESACEGCDGSGIRCPAEPSCLIPRFNRWRWTIVERCDACERFANDLDAARARFELARWVRCADGGFHAAGSRPLNRLVTPREAV